MNCRTYLFLVTKYYMFIREEERKAIVETVLRFVGRNADGVISLAWQKDAAIAIWRVRPFLSIGDRRLARW